MLSFRRNEEMNEEMNEVSYCVGVSKKNKNEENETVKRREKKRKKKKRERIHFTSPSVSCAVSIIHPLKSNAAH